MGLKEESFKLQKLITKLIKKVIKEDTNSCLKLYKAQVITAPNGTTCGVQLIGETQTLNLSYSDQVEGVVVGDFVWVATIYDSFSNAVIINTLNFNRKPKIGSLYITSDTTSPAELYGGTWEKIKDRFLLGSGDTYTLGNTGGSADAVVVEHSHTGLSVAGSQLSWESGESSGGQYSGLTSGVSNPISTTLAGVDGTGKNLPPYLVVNIWQRVA